MKLRNLHSTETLEFYIPDYSTEMQLPLFDTGISAGFPSPADDFIELSIDLNKHLIKHKDTTFFAKVKGHSMKNVGIFDGDLLVIDKSLEPQDGRIAICQIDGEFTIKRIKKEENVKGDGVEGALSANTFVNPLIAKIIRIQIKLPTIFLKFFFISNPLIIYIYEIFILFLNIMEHITHILP